MRAVTPCWCRSTSSLPIAPSSSSTCLRPSRRSPRAGCVSWSDVWWSDVWWSDAGLAPGASSPALPVHQPGAVDPLGGLELGADRVGHREQPTLGHVIERDSDDVGHLPLAVADQVQG